jgi:tRNA (guanine10-N2)-dimethyltransferase
LAKLFFLLSGENETLPAAEVKAILETEGYGYANAEVLDQILRLDSDPTSAHTVQIRAAFTRLCASELFKSDANETSVASTANNINFKVVLKRGESFSVRINRIKNYADQAINTMNLEGKLGKIILQKTENTKVNLKNPDKTFIGIITNKNFIFGIKLTEIQTRTFSERRPRKKPFFHPSAMPSKLARCMVNLAHGKTEDLVLDPFCGTGTTLIEAAYIGCKPLGVDAQRRMIIGCRKNLQHFNIIPEGLVLANACMLPFTVVDCVVTDPPYGRSASTLKSTTNQLVQEVLASVFILLKVGQRICIASPKTLNIKALGTILGYKHVESHFAYVHRTLTREIAVFEKVHE